MQHWINSKVRRKQKGEYHQERGKANETLEHDEKEVGR